MQKKMCVHVNVVDRLHLFTTAFVAALRPRNRTKSDSSSRRRKKYACLNLESCLYFLDFLLGTATLRTLQKLPLKLCVVWAIKRWSVVVVAVQLP